LGFGGGHSAQAADQLQNLSDGGVGREVGLLGDVGEIAAGGDFFPPEVVACDLDRSGVGCFDPRGELN
jgi:hypothetical protein